MIVAETPIRELDGQIQALQALLDLDLSTERTMWILGALAVLGWVRDGGQCPAEQA